MRYLGFIYLFISIRSKVEKFEAADKIFEIIYASELNQDGREEILVRVGLSMVALLTGG
jgi:hypothetical protein